MDVSLGENVDHVSSEWFSPPDGQWYLSLAALFASVKSRTERSRTRDVDVDQLFLPVLLVASDRLRRVHPGASGSGGDRAEPEPTLALVPQRDREILHHLRGLLTCKHTGDDLISAMGGATSTLAWVVRPSG